MGKISVREVGGAIRIEIANEAVELAIDQAGDFIREFGKAMKQATPDALSPETGGVELLTSQSGVLTGDGELALWFAVENFPNLFLVIPRVDVPTVIGHLRTGMNALRGR